MDGNIAKEFERSLIYEWIIQTWFIEKIQLKRVIPFSYEQEQMFLIEESHMFGMMRWNKGG